MKHNIIVPFLILSLLFTGCCTKQGVVQKSLDEKAVAALYEGTWHYQDGDELFIVSLWQEDDGAFRGYYKKVEYNNGVIGATIFNSRKVYANGVVFPPTIYGRLHSSIGISGLIHDNTLENYAHDFKDGILRMQINSDLGCSTCPVTAIWKVEEESGLRVDFIPGFSVPIDVILTKVSDEINLD